MQRQSSLRGLTATVAVLVLMGASDSRAQSGSASPVTATGATSVAAPATAAATSTAPAASVASDKIGVELNKLEALPNGCRAYVVVENKGNGSYTTLKLDLVMFQTDGVIGRRFALDLAPVKPSKTSVKLFDLDGVKCDDIGSLLVNDVLDCKSGGGEGDCLERLAVGSRTKAQLSK